MGEEPAPAPYGHDLAHVHDTGFGDFARAAAPHLLRRLARAGIRDGLVADLGCGSGIWARALADAGYGVLGIDLSADMLAIARRRVPQGRFVRGSFLDASLPPCSAVTAIGEIFSYAFDPRSGRDQLGGLFRRLHTALPPGGLLVFDVAAPGRGGGGGPPRRTYHEAADWTLCLETAEDAEHRVLTRRIAVFRRVDGAYRRSDEVHRLNLHAPAEILRELGEAGFEARRLTGYGSLRFRRGHVGFAAVRRP
jgi:SAM-dependent methyltransferase